jgi:hypothetical protein
MKNTANYGWEATRDDENFAYVAAWGTKRKPSDAVFYIKIWFSIMLNW